MRRRTKFALVLFLLLLGSLYFFRSTSRGPHIPNNSVLILDISGEYVEAPPQDLLGRIIARGEKTLAELLFTIRAAKGDDRIKAVIVRIAGFRTGWAKTLDIREALTDFRQSGKPLLAFLEQEAGASNAAYYLASACDRVYLPPSASAPLSGLASHFVFLGGLWEKLDIEMNVEKIAEYKTFGDMIAGKEMTPAHREMSNSLLDSINEHFIGTIAQARGLQPDEVQALIDRCPATADEFIDAKLADGSKFLEDLHEELGGEQAPLVDLQDYVQAASRSMRSNTTARIAVVYGVGGIVNGYSHSGVQGQMMGARTISEALHEAALDDDIKAIVFRVDSPGGSALASDLIWRATQAALKKKPVIVSMSDVAASGGYYISAGASRVLAQPTTLTGSIGVVFARPNIHGLLERLGIHTETLTRGRYAALDDLTRALDAGGRAKLIAQMQHVYDVFVSRVAAGRGLSADQVNDIGRGRVWTGSQAAHNGLVDELGGFWAAIRAAKTAAGLDPDLEADLVYYPRGKGVLDRISQALQGGGLAVPPEIREILNTLPAVREPGVLALMPERIDME